MDVIMSDKTYQHELKVNDDDGNTITFGVEEGDLYVHVSMPQVTLEEPRNMAVFTFDSIQKWNKFVEAGTDLFYKHGRVG